MGAKTTKAIAEFICRTSYEDLPPEVVDYAKVLALSHLGMNIAGATMDFGRMVTQYIRSKGGNREVGVYGAAFQTSVDYAAFANGNSAHATELEDGSPERMYSVGLWPAAFAMAEKLKLSGKDMIEGLVLGHEVACKMGVAFKSAPVRGTSPSACCTLANAVSGAKMMRLNVEQTQMALSLAASQVGGIRSQAGTGAHVVEAGFCGRNGVVAAELAALGYTGNPNIFEGKRGFGDIWAGCPAFDLPLGESYSLMRVSIRNYACCNPAKRYVDGVLELIREHAIEWKEVADVEYGIHHTRVHSFRVSEPASAEEAHFSLPHITAACFFDRNVFLSSVTDEKVHDPRWREARKKVRVTVYHDDGDDNSFKSPVIITMKNGRTYSKDCQQIESGKRGSSQQDGIKKYSDCIAFAGTFSATRAQQIADMTLALDKVDDITALSALLTFPDLI